jgi:hypothetical protein
MASNIWNEAPGAGKFPAPETLSGDVSTSAAELVGPQCKSTDARPE